MNYDTHNDPIMKEQHHGCRVIMILIILAAIFYWSQGQAQIKITQMPRAKKLENGSLAGVQNGSNVQFPTNLFASRNDLENLLLQFNLLKKQIDSIKIIISTPLNIVVQPISKSRHTYHDEFGNEYLSTEELRKIKPK